MIAPVSNNNIASAIYCNTPGTRELPIASATRAEHKRQSSSPSTNRIALLLQLRVVIVFEGAVVDELVGDYSMKDLILRMEGVA